MAAIATSLGANCGWWTTRNSNGPRTKSASPAGAAGCVAGVSALRIEAVSSSNETFARGTRLYSTFATRVDVLGCDIISGWTRSEMH